MNAKDKNGKSFLYWCIQNRKLEIAQYLIEEGVDVNARTNETTPIMLASFHGYLEVVEKLIKNGAQIDAKTSNGLDATYAASQKGHLNILKLLIENNPNVSDSQGYKGRTPLGAAAYHGHLDVVKFLITHHHVRINIEDRNHMTPLELAARRCGVTCPDQVKIINFLKENGALCSTDICTHLVKEALS